MAPAINKTTGNLTFTTAQDVNGTATIRVVLTDAGSPPASSVAKTFVITVNPINDIPVFTVNTGVAPINGSGNITTLEDAGLQSINYIKTQAVARATALDELSSQTRAWTVGSQTRTSGNLTLTQLSVDPATGVLKYNTTKDTAGSATVLLTLTDSGSGVSPNVKIATRVVTINVTQVNDAPVAATGNYVLDEGNSLYLSASGSSDADITPYNFGQTLSYTWDLNNDGVYETNAGSSAIIGVPWSTLVGLGITAPNVSTIRLKVTDSSGAANNTGTTTATLTTLIVDYGDAPDTYGTLKTGAPPRPGASHTIANGLFLGATVTKEGNARSPLNGLSDTGDDGVAFPTSFEASPTIGLPAYVDITASKVGKLDIWLDLNRNGVFEQATEHLGLLAPGYDVVAGVNRILFTIPAGAMVGDTYMRFRISSAGGLLPTGRANDGEVEDYAVKIKPLQAPVTPTIYRPIDFNLADGKIPQTSDLTPTIVWSTHPENNRYDVSVKNAANVTVFSQTGTTFTSVNVTTTLGAGTYTAIVIAYNKGNVAAPAATWQFKVVPMAVASPLGDIASSRPTVNWNAVEGSKTYTVVIEDRSSGATVLTKTITTASVVPPAIPNQFTLTSDLPLGIYRVRVRATDAADLPGDWSPYVNFQVRTAPVITAPVGTVISQRPQVTWTAVTGAVTYTLELKNLTDNLATVTVPNLTVTNWTPPANLPLAKYSVRVWATNTLGQNGFNSAVQTFNVAPKPTAITPIGSLNDATPTFAWNPVPSADTYELIVKAVYGAKSVVISQTALTTTMFTQPAAQTLPMGRYTYTIRATNNPSNGSTSGAAVSSFSQTYQFTVIEYPTVTQPDNTTFSSHPEIQWTKPVGGSQSEVWISQWTITPPSTTRVLGQIDYQTFANSNITGTTYTPSKLFGIGDYVVWVRTSSVVDPGIVSNWSIGKSFRVTTPPVLIGPTGRTPDPKPTLTWQSVAGAQTYEVWVNSASSNISKVFYQEGLSSLSVTVPTNLPIGRYLYWVRAKSAFGDLSSWSIPLQFQIVTEPTLLGQGSSTFDTTPTFTWNNMAQIVGGKPTGATSYDFEMDNLTNNTTMKFHGLTTTSYTVATPLATGYYRARVRAISTVTPATNSTQGDFSYPYLIFVGGRPEVKAIPPTTNTTPTLSWLAVYGASGYEVFIATAAQPGMNLLSPNANTTGATAFTVPQPLAKGDYRYWIRAINASNGLKSNWSVEKTLLIVDAADLSPALPDATEFVWTVVPGLVPKSMVSESAISMIPAIVNGSQYTPVPEQDSAGEPDVRMLPVPEAALIAPSADELVSEEQTDSILSGWDENTWWETQPQQQKQAEKQQSSAAVGFLGALFALAPRSLKRRKDE